MSERQRVNIRDLIAVPPYSQPFITVVPR